MGATESAQALLRWRLMGKKMLDVMQLYEDNAQADAKEAAWLSSGSAAGLAQYSFTEGLPASSMEPQHQQPTRHIQPSKNTMRS